VSSTTKRIPLNPAVQTQTHAAHRCRYGRPFRMLRRALSVTNSRMAEERTLRPNRVDDLRPMSHPTAGCAAITLEPETWKRSANMRQSGRSDSVSRTAHRHRYLRVSAAVVCE
jgi:hypothetical protein